MPQTEGVLPPGDLTATVGASGLAQFGGYIVEDRAPADERDWQSAFVRMRDTSAVVGALMTAFTTLIRAVDWTIEPADDSPDAATYATFAEEALHDMHQTWADVLTEITTMFVFGWALLEQTYKRRQGPDPPDLAPDVPGFPSRYRDGRVGWATWALRSQETLLRWEFDAHGLLRGMWQLAPPRYIPTLLPMEKCLLFRTTAQRGNPLGRSILRSAYRAFSHMEKIERLEGIGIERDLAGLPVIDLPASIIERANAGDPAASAVYASAQKTVQNLRRDTMEGVVLPVTYDERGNRTTDLRLLSTGGSRQFDTNGVIQRYGEQIAMSTLADFIYVGHAARGSYALISEKTKLFTTGVSGYLDGIAATVNLDALPRLMRLNGWDPALAPRLTHGGVGATNLAELGAYLTAVAGAGLIDPTDDAVRHYVRTAANLPEPVSDADLTADSGTASRSPTAPTASPAAPGGTP